MNRLAVFLLLTLAASLHGGALAQTACDYPAPLSNLPDGDTATKDEMLAAQGSVKDYIASVEAYMDCLDTEFDSLGDAATDAHRLIRAKRRNLAIEVMEGIASDFNVAVRAYRAREQ